MNNYFKISLNFIITLLLVLLLYSLITSFLIDTITLNTDALKLSAQKKSNLFVLKRNNFLKYRIKNGDIVIFYQKFNKKPIFIDLVVSFFTFNKISKYKKISVGRVMGSDKDKFLYKDGILYRYENGKPVKIKEFSNDYKEMFLYKDEIVLKDNEYFIITDNNTPDSNIGNIFQDSDIYGKVLFMYFPLKNYGLIKNAIDK